jgi:ATP-dependent 26S proteasome regulatory subunit
MDGFKQSENVVVIGASNRPDLIDEAVLRPGRIDRKIEIGLPKVKDRFQILKLNLAKRTSNVTDKCMEHIAKNTEGFSGADIENMVNEVCFQCIRENHSSITDNLLVQMFQQVKEKMGTFKVNCLTRSISGAGREAFRKL